MDSLIKAFDDILDLLKGIKPGTVAGGRDMPSLSMPKASVKPPVQNSSTKISSVKPPSQKNPVKQAQQIQNKDIKDIKMREAQSALKLKGVEKADEPVKIKTPHTAEEKIAHLNSVYEKHQKNFNAAKARGQHDQYSLNMMDHVNRQMNELHRLKKEEESEFVKIDDKGQWSIQKRCHSKE